jgi:hypothetical protein
MTSRLRRWAGAALGYLRKGLQFLGECGTPYYTGNGWHDPYSRDNS